MYLPLVLFSHIMSAAEIAYVSSEFDIFAHKPFQTSVFTTIENTYKPIAPWIKMIWNFLYLLTTKPKYISISISTSRFKLVSDSGKDVDALDHTAVTNKFLNVNVTSL